MTFYWMTTNFISVTQASILRAEGIRQVFGIPKHIKWDKNKLPVKEKTMRESFRESKCKSIYIMFLNIQELSSISSLLNDQS